MPREDRKKKRRGSRGESSKKSRKKSSSEKGRRGGFSYNRSADAVKRRAEQSGGNRDTIIKDEFKVYKVQDKNHLRILPPTWDDAEHYAYDAWVYFGIGPDGSSFLSLSDMKDEEDPILEERKRAEREGDMEYADKLKAKKRPTCWVIDRNNEDEGPQIWSMPWTVDRDIATQMIHHKTGEVIPIDDPYEGFDLYFNREGKGRNTKYVGISIDRDESPALDDEDDLEELLEFIEENPVPDTFDFADYEHISKVFDAETSRANHERDSDDDDDDDGDDDDDNDGPTWDDIHSMSRRKLERLVDDEDLGDDLNEDLDDYEDDELADEICDLLDIDPPKKKKSKKDRKKSSAAKRRMREMDDDDEDDEDDEEEESPKRKRRKRR